VQRNDVSMSLRTTESLALSLRTILWFRKTGRGFQLLGLSELGPDNEEVIDREMKNVQQTYLIY